VKRIVIGIVAIVALLIFVVPVIAGINAAATSGFLPFTGSPVRTMLIVAAALITVGGLLLLPGRRSDERRHVSRGPLN
jgi:hypothetical protein